MNNAEIQYNEEEPNVGTRINSSGRIKHLVFSLGESRYGIPLSSVKEVIGMTDITPVPHVPIFFTGFINLRGKIHSVIDLRLKLGLPKTEVRQKKTSIIITEIDGFTIGAIVDDVNEVVGFQNNQIETSLNISSDIDQEYISGVAKIKENNSLILLLSINKILNAEELRIIKSKY